MDYERKPTTALAGVFIISNAALGAGTLAFPQAFAKTGLYLSLPILALCAMLCGLSLGVCAFANYETKTVEYYQAMGFYCGPLMETFFHLAMVTGTIGLCTLYMITVGDQSDQIIDRIWSDPDERDNLWYLDRQFVMTLLCTVVILPLCLAKNIDFLKWPSSLGVLSMVYLMIVIVIDYFNSDAKDNATVDKYPADFTDVFESFPTILLSYQCMSNAFPVFGALKQPSLRDYVVTIFGSIFICSLVYLPVGLFGYLRNGADVKSNVLLSYNSDDNKILVAQAAVLISVLMSYPIMFWVAKECLIKMWKSGKEFYLNTISQRRTEYEARTHTPLQRYTITIVFFVSTLGMALGLPDISVAVTFTGSFAAYFYLICPGLILIQTTYINEQGLFLKSVRPERRYYEHTIGDTDPEEAMEELIRESQIVTVNRIRGNQSSESLEAEFEEHQTADTDLIDVNRSRFLVNKYSNGSLCWTLRITGLLLCALGMFLTGLGLVDAIYGVIDIL
ncbi:sodium-coupled neutral amino acid transporter 7-like [Convolutriloba macropyga]|uniref:sodium-coupled neutral amino acid transporter 7-like n=1 Tax=Convolutriloba macropyga TaxID=536237 RepID=UPI003F5290F1